MPFEGHSSTLHNNPLAIPVSMSGCLCCSIQETPAEGRTDLVLYKVATSLTAFEPVKAMWVVGLGSDKANIGVMRSPTPPVAALTCDADQTCLRRTFFDGSKEGMPAPKFKYQRDDTSLDVWLDCLR